MTAKEYLSQYKALWHEYEEALETYARVIEDTEKVPGIRYDKDKIQSFGQQDLSDLVALRDRARADLSKAAERYYQKMKEIRDSIDEIEKPEYRELLKRRYIEFQSFDTIAEEMNFELQTIYNFHGLALLQIKVSK